MLPGGIDLSLIEHMFNSIGTAASQRRQPRRSLFFLFIHIQYSYAALIGGP